jgi:hypothetical protein
MHKMSKSSMFLFMMIFIPILAAAQEVRTIRIEVSPSVLEVIRTWDRNIWFFTPEDKPIRSLTELTREDIACWGAEHFSRMQSLFKALGLKGEGVKILGDGAYNDSKNKPLLYVTWAKFAPDLQGVLQVEFVGSGQIK